MTHFLDERRNIPKQMPKEAREMVSFLAMLVVASTKINANKLTLTDIRWFEKRCQGNAWVEILSTKDIHWMYFQSDNAKRISHL